MTQREAVYELDQGRCVNCGVEHHRNAGPWAWTCHHVIRQQVLRRRKVKPARIRDATFCVLLCTSPCHERQTTAFKRVPFERLPARVVEAVDALGPWAQDALRRQHPISGA